MFSKPILICISQLLFITSSIQDAIAPRQAAATDACSYVEDVLDICESLSPGFTTMAVTDQAPCLCYSSTAWIPEVFDGAVYTCAQYAYSAIPSEYSDLADLEGFCSIAGNVLYSAGPAQAPATTTDVNLISNSACSYVLGGLDYCNSASPGFTTMDPSSQAPCLCYDSTSWIPGVFDGAVLGCANYASTAAPSDYSVFVDLEGFCTSVGDVLSEPSAPSSAVVSKGTSSPGIVATLSTPRSTTIATPKATSVGQQPTSTSKSTSGSSTVRSGLRDGLGMRVFFVALTMVFLL